MRCVTPAVLVCLGAALPLSACDVRVADDGGVSVGVAAGKASDEWVRTYPLDATSDVRLEAGGGPIEVSGTDGTAIEVRVVRQARAASDEAAREALGASAIRESVSGRAVSIDTRSSSRGSRGGSRTPRVSAVEHHVRLPRGAAASFAIEGGGITLKDVHGRLTVSVVNGGIVGTGLSGALTASVVNGGIQIEMASVTDSLDLSVVSGGIRLTLPRDSRASLAGSAVNGGVSIADALGFVREAGSDAGQGPTRRVAGSLNGGGPKITAQATNGGVRIEVAEPGAPPSPSTRP
jgi:hypothetical protein